MSDRPFIAVVDYGMGNRRSAEKALERVGAQAKITREHADLEAADGLVVPGVGAFPQATRNLDTMDLRAPIVERARAGTPLLGICLGMQLLFDSSTEREGAEGLGLLSGPVSQLRTAGKRLPHIGWNMVRWQRSCVLNDELPAESAMYHVHSFAPSPTEPADVIGVAGYGEDFVTAVAHDNVFGVQFHPEKSSTHGLKLLEGFVSLCRTPASAAA